MKKMYALIACMTVCGAALFAQGRRALYAHFIQLPRRVKMKKNVFVVGIVSTALIIGFFLTSCAGSPSPDLGVYDASVSEDQQVTLEIAGGLKVV